MNKLNLIITIVITSLLASCALENFKEYDLNDLSKSFEGTLLDGSQENPSQIEIIIKGSIKGKGIIEFENGAGRYNKIEVNGKIDQYYKTDWYQQKLNFKYRPISEINGGSIKLKYRIY